MAKVPNVLFSYVVKDDTFLILWDFLLVSIGLKVCPWGYKQVWRMAVGDEVWGMLRPEMSALPLPYQ
jgi:hypothetical protein